ncbi:MAG: iron-containing redox enzyme family protein [Acidobacteria bacterium]|nr:iron-containing redox enzyme family protein [Acidobacteriota bacterium]
MDRLLRLRAATVEGISKTHIAQAARAGTLSKRMYGRYLLNVWHYAQHSSVVIGLAGSRAVQCLPPLADYLFHHAQEEMGHDAWVFEDLINLGMSEDEIRASKPTTHCAAMVGYEYFMALVANPISIFGWLYVLEAMGDDLGQEIAQHLARNPVTAQSIKFVAGHGEADVAHTADLTNMIQSHITGSDLEDVVHAAEVIKDLYIGLFRDCGT